VVGPTLGGYLTEYSDWRWIFWINVPIGLLAFLMTNRVLKRLPRHERPHRLDVAGAGLMMTATVLLLLALTWGGARFPWASAPIVALLAGSTVLWGLFAFRLITAREPFLPLTLLTNPVVGFGTASVSFVFGTMIGLSIFVPIYFETVLGLSASHAGLMLIPFMGGVVIGSTASGRLMSVVTHYKRIGLIGLPAAALCLAPLALAPAQLSIAAVGALLFVAGNGIGTVFPLTTVAVQNAVLPWQLGTVTGLINFMRALSSALMVALYGAFLFGGAGAQSVTLEQLFAAGHNGAALAGHFRLIFAAAAICTALSCAFLAAMEERALRTGAPAPVPAE